MQLAVPGLKSTLVVLFFARSKSSNSLMDLSLAQHRALRWH
jgi:hypothetical protein